MERNVKTEQGQTERMKKDDWSRWIQSQRESEREREGKKQVVILRFLSGLVLLGGGEVRPRPPVFFCQRRRKGYAGGDASRMLIRQNANWKESRKRKRRRWLPPSSCHGRRPQLKSGGDCPSAEPGQLLDCLTGSQRTN